jgi:cytosine/uracil/thiamine/allantoin permease
MCCKYLDTILAAIILIFAIWPTFIPWINGKWIVAIAAIVILLHDLICKKCKSCELVEKEKPKQRTRKK